MLLLRSIRHLYPGQIWTGLIGLIFLCACAPVVQAAPRGTRLPATTPPPTRLATPLTSPIPPKNAALVQNTVLPDPVESPTPTLLAAAATRDEPPGLVDSQSSFATDVKQPAPPAPVSSPTPDRRLDPRRWPAWPVIPEVSARAVAVYQTGLAQGSDPHTFSVIGDCQSEPPVFMGRFDLGRYTLSAQESNLQETIDWFKGNFGRQHITVKNGFSVASALSPLWADQELCLPAETPLDCEFRLYRPSIVFISLGTNWKNGNGYTHGARLREVVEAVLAHGSLPVLSTKADNQEGDHSINLSTAEIAYEYDLPLWNFWAAVQDLAFHGLDPNRTDLNYLTVEAWGVRSYSGLRALDQIWRAVDNVQPSDTGA